VADQNLFAESVRTHVLMITNHGVHEWSVVPGLPDTGGQNVYVNQFTESLIQQGYLVTIVNRGGYPHPVTGEPQTGVVHHPSGQARILYIEDGVPEVVRKEDMGGHISDLVVDLQRRLADEARSVDLIISHYWDGAMVGAALNDRLQAPVPHVWVPHSLGALKKHNMDPASWEALRIDERIGYERDLMSRVDGNVATSSAIRDSYIDDYGVTPAYFLPPCIDVNRYHPQHDSTCDGVWSFLERHSALSMHELQSRRIVTEISRTDRTKRKDVLIRAFARACEQLPGLLLVVSLDPRAGAAYDDAIQLISELHIERDVVILGSVWEELPCLYGVTTVYCTPSVMEGFGMSAQEASASGVPVVASDLVPFATEYLLGAEPVRIAVDGAMSGSVLMVGEGGIVAPADDVGAFSQALVRLLSDEEEAAAMGRRGLDITVPYFTWERRTADLLYDLGVTTHSVHL
jgi:mannosylfructose-phosphate synthase